MITKRKLKNFLLLNILYTILFLNSSITYANSLEESPSTLEISEDSEVSEELLELSGYGAVLIDAKTGLVLFDKNMNESLYPASMTKVMTTLLLLEYGNLDETLVHSHNAVYNIGPGSSHIGMREGEEITLEQALYAMLLASANEVCMAVAEHISGSVEDFVEKMNEKAKELGAVNTHFANPHGYHDDEHYTTPYDMALIMQEALKYEKFQEVISTETYTIPATNLVNEERILNNTNKMIKSWSEFYYPSIIGGKTGFTDEAKNTLTSYAKNGDVSLIAVVMKADGTEVYSDTAKLFDYSFSLYEDINVFNKEDFSTTTPVIQTFKETSIDLGSIEVIAKSDLTLNLPKFINTSEIKQNIDLKENIEGPIYVGDEVGTLEFLYNDTKIGEVALISNTEIEVIPESTLIRKEKFNNFISITLKFLKYLAIFIVSFLIILFILTRITKRLRRNKRRRLRFSSYPNPYKNKYNFKKSNKKFKNKRNY